MKGYYNNPVNQCDGCRARVKDPDYWRNRREGRITYHDRLVNLGKQFKPRWIVQMICQADKYANTDGNLGGSAPTQS